MHALLGVFVGLAAQAGQAGHGVPAVASPPFSTPSSTAPHFESVGRGVIPRDVVRSLAQDAAGFLWIATGNGLVRHDGYRFQPVEFDRADPARRNLGWVQAMAAARDGRVWIATEAEGLASHEPATDELRLRPVPIGDRMQPQVTALAEDGDGWVWAGTRHAGLWRHRVVSDGRHEVESWSGRPEAGWPAAHESIGALAVDAAGSLWVGSASSRETLRRRLPGQPGFETVTVSDGRHSLAGRQVLALMPDRAGRLWIGTREGDLVVVDPSGAAPPHWLPEPVGGRGATSALTQSDDGRVWVGTARGLEVWRPDPLTLQHRLQQAPGMANGLAANEVMTLLKDQAGAVWVGGLGIGLQRHDPAGSAVKVLRPVPGGSFDGNAHALLGVDDGQVWVATASQPLLALDRGLRPTRELIAPRPQANGRVPRVTAMAQAADGSVWLALDKRLLRLDRAGRELGRWPLDTPAVVRMRAEAGQLWLATEDGLYHWRTGTRVPARRLRLASGAPVVGQVQALARDPAGRLWIGAVSGLYVLPAGRDDGVEPVAAAPGQGLGNPVVGGLLVDREGRLWVDTAVTGLHRMLSFDGRAAAFDPVSTRHGLHNRPFGVNLMEDRRGRIWTQQFVYDPAGDELLELTAADGKDFGMGWFFSHTQLPDGRMLFGGTRGVLVVEPERFDAAVYMPPLAVTSLRLDGRRASLAGLPQRLTLGPDHHGVALEFAALEFADPQRIRYAYRLEGVDQDWVPTTADFRVASYGNLAPGRYTLEIRATNRSGRWRERPLTVAVVVTPAWWRHPATRVGAAALVLLLAASVLQWRTHSLRRRQRELEQRVRERTLELFEATRALERKSEQLEQASLTDPLSGLHNRRHLLNHIEHDVALALRRLGADPNAQDADLILFLMDIDHFKRINDERGHAAGDAVIRQLPERLRPVFRTSDHLVRWGGEEFLIVARSTSRGHAAELAERARRAVCDTAFVLDDGDPVRVSCSIGFTCFPPDPLRPQALTWHEALAVADAALLEAKGAGRNRWAGVVSADMARPPCSASAWLSAEGVAVERGGGDTGPLA